MRRLYTLLLLCGIVIAATTHSPQRAQSSPVAAPGTSDFGSCTHIASRYGDPDSMHVPGAQIANLGIGWAREDFQMSRILENVHNGEGEYEWYFHEQMVKELRGHGVNIIGVLVGPTPSWASVNGCGLNQFCPPKPDVFADFAYEVVSHFKDDVHYWEIWNEPDNPIYWAPVASAAQYTEVLKAGYEAIKRADPSAQVLVAGMVSPAPADKFLEEIHAHGGWDSFDIISLHPYTDPLGPEEGQIAVSGLGKVKGVAEALGEKPIWVTEFGWSTGPSDRIKRGEHVNPQKQAELLVRASTLLRVGGAEKVLLYTLKDVRAPQDPPGRNLYGLIYHAGDNLNYSSVKPAFNAYKTLNEQLAGTRPEKNLKLVRENMALDFESEQKWRSYPPENGELTHAPGQGMNGSTGGQLTYNFTTRGNDYVAYIAEPPIPIGDPSQLGISIRGDGSGHNLKVQILDSEGEKFQFRLGFLQSGGWKTVDPVSINVDDPEILDRRDGRLTYPLSLFAIVIDDEPDSATGQGTVYVDNLISVSGPEVYATRYLQNDGMAVDVLWALQYGVDVNVPTNSSQGTKVDIWGEEEPISAQGGSFSVSLSPSPIYLHHAPADERVTPPEPINPDPDPNEPSDDDEDDEDEDEDEDRDEDDEPKTRNPVDPPAGAQCFDATGYCIHGRIAEYWNENGGLKVFGYPISPQWEQYIEGQWLEVQWFERNRLELHPQNERPYDVLLGRLSEELLLNNKRVWQEEPKSSPQDGCRYFDETGFNVCGRIFEEWRASGLEIDGVPGKSEGENLALFGLPLGDASMEIIEGEQYLVQWFERARFEVHPENPSPFDILLGLLGNETLGGD
jgi:hypothetical protein